MLAAEPCLVRTSCASLSEYLTEYRVWELGTAARRVSGVGQDIGVGFVSSTGSGALSSESLWDEGMANDYGEFGPGGEREIALLKRET